MGGGLVFEKAKNKIFIGMQQKESKSFLNALKSMDGDEIGSIVAFAADIKNSFISNGYDLNDPLVLHSINPNLVVGMIAQVKKLQQNNQENLVPGFMVWIFSLRAANDFELRNLARQIWGELSRGFGYVPEVIMNFPEWFPADININNYNEFPIGLAPQERKAKC